MKLSNLRLDKSLENSKIGCEILKSDEICHSCKTSSIFYKQRKLMTSVGDSSHFLLKCYKCDAFLILVYKNKEFICSDDKRFLNLMCHFYNEEIKEVLDTNNYMGLNQEQLNLLKINGVDLGV